MWKWSCTIWVTLCDYHHKSLTKERLRARSCTHWLYYTGYVFLVALAFTVYRHHRIVGLWPTVAQYSAYSTLGLSSSLLLLRLENLYFVYGTQGAWKSELLWWEGHLKNVDEITQPDIIFDFCIGQLYMASNQEFIREG